MQLLEKIRNPEFWERMEKSRYGIMATFLMVQCCYASVAICYICQLPRDNQFIPLSLVAIATMAANAGNIMLLPMKWIFGLFINCMLIATFTLIYALV